MSDERNPRRLPCTAPGDFYATGEHPSKATDPSDPMGDCLACGGPEGVAPQLLAELNLSNSKTYFVRQPITEPERELACLAIEHCCVSALQYGGTDRTIISRLDNDPHYCDYLMDRRGNLVYCLDDKGELLDWAAEIVNAICYGTPRPDVPTYGRGQ